MSQGFADPMLNILTEPDQITESKYGLIKVTAGNAGNTPIVNNSLYIVLSVGMNCRATSVIINSHWKKKSVSKESVGNTIILYQKEGFAASNLVEFYVRVKGVAPYIVNDENIPSTITAHIGYITAHNPLLNGALNVSQGNTNTENDNATTSLKVNPKQPKK